MLSLHHKTLFGLGSRTRTCTLFRASDFKSDGSTRSPIPSGLPSKIRTYNTRGLSSLPLPIGLWEVVSSAGLEPATSSFVAKCSNPIELRGVVHVVRFKLTNPAWKAGMIITSSYVLLAEEWRLERQRLLHPTVFKTASSSSRISSIWCWLGESRPLGSEDTSFTDLPAYFNGLNQHWLG